MATIIGWDTDTEPQKTALMNIFGGEPAYQEWVKDASIKEARRINTNSEISADNAARESRTETFKGSLPMTTAEAAAEAAEE